MKIKIAIVILIVACVALGVALFATKKQDEQIHGDDVKSIDDFSNQLVDVHVELNDLRQVNISLTNDLAMSRAEAAQLSNSLASALATISETRTALNGAEDQITNLNAHVSELDGHVADLETQNKSLEQRAEELTNTITDLDEVISNTRSQMALMTTNSAYLQNELQKQMSQRAELEHKFNDLNEVRTQVAKLKEEIFIARRMKLMKNDHGDMKGAQLLMVRTPPPVTNHPAATTPGNYDLNVEVGSDGSVKVIPPVTSTNSTAH